ncbi:MAG TPA: hypothetical protein VM029_22800, partial [Opitutaceae bacterium]|nr:hypothetical protein [Opitutaceae bacterium]
NLARTYHDGAVQPDGRVAPRVDSSGNPIIDPQTGSAIFDPIAPDGRTNTWSYSDARQLSAQEGYVAFHSYSAEVTDTAVRQKDSASTFGMELAVSRDMGALFGSKRLAWTITAGMSVNDLSANTADNVGARVRTVTDYFSLFGNTPPAAPYSAPSSSTTNVLDPSGNPVVDESGVVRTITTDTTVLLGNAPAGRTDDSIATTASVNNRWKLRGAYFTFRAGPTLWIPITARLKASLSAGAALVYAGTDYTVTQVFQPELGAEISDTSTSAAYKLLAGYYADASLQFDITERAGIYAGAVFQSTGSYTQELNSATANYSTKVDLGNQSGLRAGMSIRF